MENKSNKKPPKKTKDLKITKIDVLKDIKKRIDDKFPELKIPDWVSKWAYYLMYSGLGTKKNEYVFQACNVTPGARSTYFFNHRDVKEFIDELRLERWTELEDEVDKLKTKALEKLEDLLEHGNDAAAKDVAFKILEKFKLLDKAENTAVIIPQLIIQSDDDE